MDQTSTTLPSSTTISKKRKDSPEKIVNPNDFKSPKSAHYSSVKEVLVYTDESDKSSCSHDGFRKDAKHHTSPDYTHRSKKIYSSSDDSDEDIIIIKTSRRRRSRHGKVKKYYGRKGRTTIVNIVVPPIVINNTFSGQSINDR